jgi:glycosidase
LNGSYTLNQEVDSTFYFSQKFNVFDNVFKKGGPTQAIAEQFDRKQSDYASTPNQNGIGVAARDALVNFMDNHDVPRFLFDKPSPAALRSALGYLLTEDGIPCLYYGTEQEFSGGNDPFNRERLWDTGFTTDGATFQWIRKLIAIRKAYAPLRRGALTLVFTTAHVGAEADAGLVAFERTDGDQRVLVAIDTRDDGSASAAVTTHFAPGTTLVDVAAAPDAVPLIVGDSGVVTLTVAARQTRILVPAGAVVPLP